VEKMTEVAAQVATSSARRAVAVRNLATLRWRRAEGRADPDAWAVAAEAMHAAADADRDPALLVIALDGWDNALRVGRGAIGRELADRIRAGLDRAAAAGAAGDRVGELRARLPHG